MGSTIKTDCFAFDCVKCSALEVLLCKKSKCRFYKSKIDFINQIQEMYGINDINQYFEMIMQEGE